MKGRQGRNSDGTDADRCIGNSVGSFKKSFYFNEGILKTDQNARLGRQTGRVVAIVVCPYCYNSREGKLDINSQDTDMVNHNDPGKANRALM